MYPLPSAGMPEFDASRGMTATVAGLALGRGRLW
jgi:hypothetical protein